MIDGDNTAYGVVFCPNDRIILFEPSGTHYQQIEYFADGSGGQLALGALANGATAIQAVMAASKHDIYTGGPLQILKR